MTTPLSTGNISSITRDIQSLILDKRESLRQKVKESNKTLTFAAMEAASSLDNIPRCYLPDRDLNHFPPLWFLGILAPTTTSGTLLRYTTLFHPAPLHPTKTVCMRTTRSQYTAKIEFVHDNTRTSQYCVFICSNYTLAEMEDCLLKLWDFIQPPQTVAWYLDAAADPSPQRGERADWLLDFDLVWETKYAAKTRSSSSIIPA
ncbi:hypothetical protein CPB85DRAFT_1252838 [Mucidula mucida]|nr:hypothetical protein CPB85DRAFT_1252838 [Mucidula mucida]